MPKLAVSVPHTLSQEEATRRIQERVNLARETFQERVQDLEEHWDGNRLAFRFTTFGFPIQGEVASEPAEVQVNADLPLAAMMFKGMIEQQVREELSRVLT
jgi:hypothetical protein